MTDYSDVPTIYTGDWIDAAWLNQYVGDNFRALKQGLANAGDVPYALDGNTIAALAKPVSAAGFLKMLTIGVPEYVPTTQMPGGLHAKGFSFTDSGDSTSSTGYVSIGSGLVVSLSLVVTCTVIGIAFGSATKNSAISDGGFRLKIDGTADPNENVRFRSVSNMPFCTLYYRTGILAGTRDVELLFRTNNASDSIGLSSGGVIALAFAEG